MHWTWLIRALSANLSGDGAQKPTKPSATLCEVY